jgi:outer membrane protein TolC
MERNSATQQQYTSMRSQLFSLLAVAGLLAAAGCQRYSRVQMQAERLVDHGRQAVSTEQAVASARTSADQPVDWETRAIQVLRRRFPEGDPLVFDPLELTAALEIATALNRDYADERNDNLRSALNLVVRANEFSPQLHATVTALTDWDRDTDVDTTDRVNTVTASAGADYRSVYGTDISVDLTADADTVLEGTGSDDRALVASVLVAQPLLRDAGRLVVREPLTQAERNLIYRLRAFELFRQDFATDAVALYYDLILRKQIIANNVQRYEQANFLYRRAKALFNVGRVPEIDVFQAEQQQLQAENDVRQAREEYETVLEQYKVFLGVPKRVSIVMPDGAHPEFAPVEMDEQTAVRLALTQRLDLKTAADRIDDARRGIRIAANDLLPRLDLTVSADATAVDNDSFSDDFTQFGGSAQIQLVLPLERTGELVARHRAELTLMDVERAYELLREDIARDVRAQLRLLRRIAQSLEVQEKIVNLAQKRLAVAQTRFRLGTRPSRDVVEAQEDLLVAQNRYIGFIVDHAVAAMRLRQLTGEMRVAPSGLPDELPRPVTDRPPDIEATPNADAGNDSGNEIQE